MDGPTVFRITITIIIAAIIVSNVPQITGFSVEETCQSVRDKTFIADPKNCEGWVQCVDGLPNYGRCTNGLFFNVITGRCDYPERVYCARNIKTMCHGLTNVYKPHPFNCQNYCYCNDGESYCTSCPIGQVFEPFTQQCVWPENTQCEPSPCFLAPNDFIKDISSCTRWIRCAYGAVVSMGDCPSGFYFNAKTGICDYAENVECKSDTKLDVPIADPFLCENSNFGALFLSDDATCRGYFFCASKNEPLWGQCPEGTNFDHPTQMCTDPYLVQCPYNRCEGMSRTFMTVPNTHCQQYYVCSKGAVVSLAVCPSDYPYFNEEAQACQTEPVFYPICETYYK